MRTEAAPLPDADGAPGGFVAMRPYGAFGELVGPIFEREVDAQVILGLRVQDKHCNRLSGVHGGMLSTLADTALACGVRRAAELKLGTSKFTLVTTQISVNFVGNVVAGRWLEAHVDVQRVGSRVGFASCRIVDEGKLIVQASGQFMITSPARLGAIGAKRAGEVPD